MFALLILSVGADPTFAVENKCPPAFTVVNRCPAPKAKPVKVTNGLNCTASFCGANGGPGCPSCPNGNGTCACGTAQAPATASPVTPAYLLPVSGNSTCPNGNCPSSNQSVGRFRLFR